MLVVMCIERKIRTQNPLGIMRASRQACGVTKLIVGGVVVPQLRFLVLFRAFPRQLAELYQVDRRVRIHASGNLNLN